MITIVGTNHTFDISEPIEFIIKCNWPDAVLVELDDKRYSFINDKNELEGQLFEEKKLEKVSWMYRSIIKHQNRIAKYHQSYVGSDMFTAIKIGRFIGAEIGLIDTNIKNLMKDTWIEMSIPEKIRYFLSTVIDSVSIRRKNKQPSQLLKNEEKTMVKLRRKYPTIMKKLIDERDAYMAKQIKNYAKKFHNMVVVVGDAHITGIVSLLRNYNVREIRFRDIINKNRFNNIRSEIWNDKGGNNGS
ncbi:MAG: TraB/GumN family protein [archaeon]|nr:TraB/GumN family protein [archaeon]